MTARASGPTDGAPRAASSPSASGLSAGRALGEGPLPLSVPQRARG